jgi:hypothetical protein
MSFGNIDEMHFSGAHGVYIHVTFSFLSKASGFDKVSKKYMVHFGNTVEILLEGVFVIQDFSTIWQKNQVDFA